MTPSAAPSGRFAPSPSGPLHFGSLYTACASYLDARQKGLSWVVRIEDVDESRCDPAKTATVEAQLRAYGFAWDEPALRQSRRKAAYVKALARLARQGEIFACAMSRKEFARQGGAPLSPGRGAALSEAQLFDFLDRELGMAVFPDGSGESGSGESEGGCEGCCEGGGENRNGGDGESENGRRNEAAQAPRRLIAPGRFCVLRQARAPLEGFARGAGEESLGRERWRAPDPRPRWPGAALRRAGDARCLGQAIRMRARDEVAGADDEVFGRVEQNILRDVGDFALLGRDGHFSYQLSSVVDDAAQGVERVVRGADLLDSTPRQIFLARRLGAPAVSYAHLPLIVNRCGEKWSKQTRAPALPFERPARARALRLALKLLGVDGEWMREADCAALLEGAVGRFDWRRIATAPIALDLGQGFGA